MRSVPATSEAVFVCSLAKLVVVADQEVFVVGLITTAAAQFVRPFVATVQTTSFLYCQSLLRQEVRTLQATQHVLACQQGATLPTTELSYTLGYFWQGMLALGCQHVSS